VAYGEALCKAALVSIRKKMLDFFVQEGSDEGSELLTLLRNRSVDDTERKDFQGALLRLHSKRIDPARLGETPRGYAWVSNCDGQGGFFILGVFENSDGTSNVVDLFLHAGGDICDGTVYPRRSVVEVDAIKKNMERELGCFFIEVALREAAKLIEINQMGPVEKKQTMSDDTGRAVALFEAVECAFRWGEGSCCPPVAVVFPDDVYKLMERPEYEDTWFLELGDFSEEREPSANPDQREDRMKANRVSRVEHSVRFRLIAMAEHMARFHFWKGETKEASLCRALAASVRKDFFQSPLVRGMLRRSMDAFELFSMSDHPLYQGEKD
jgi:hypothetical protein